MDNTELNNTYPYEDGENTLKIFTKEYTNTKTGSKFNKYFGVDGDFSIKVEFSKGAFEKLTALNLNAKVFDLTFLDSQHFIKEDLVEDKDGIERKYPICVITDFVKATPSVLKPKHIADYKAK